MAVKNPNPWRMKYRFVIFAVSAAHALVGGVAPLDGAGDSAIILIGYDPGATANATTAVDIFNYNQALTQCVSFIRRFQATGKDVRGTMYGQPFGQNDPNTAYKLEGQGTGLPDSPVVSLPKMDEEMEYALIDTPSPYLKLRMNLASRSQTDALFTGEHAPDVHSEA